MLEMLAEECTELAQASLKLSRKIRRENYTPRSEEACLKSLTEELADVMVCINQIDDIVDMAAVKKIQKEKLDRWKARMNIRH